MNQKALSEPTIIVIFGITGDLTRRKLFPALENLFAHKLISPKTTIIGITRQSISTEDLVQQIISKDDIKKNPFPLVTERLVVNTMNVTNGNDYDKLLKDLNKIEEDEGVCMHRLYYLSIPPQVFSPIVKFLGEHGLNDSCPHGVSDTRLLVEKPFGYDIKSAKELIADTVKYFDEEQVFRVDHYLAKETVQNILTFRFDNTIFESLWDHKYIESIKIMAYEKIGIEGRSAFYEQTGALRDLIQSHLLQLLSIVAMERADLTSSKSIHNSKLALFKSIHTVPQNKVNELSVRGQYKTYKKEVDNPESFVETFASVKLSIENERWDGVPIVLETGKALDQKKTEIVVSFKGDESRHSYPNSLIFRIQPNEGIDLTLCVKKPGLDNELQSVTMDFSYDHYFKNISDVGTYEKVLTDAIKGDRTLFATSDEIIESWRIINEVLLTWSKDGAGLHIYENGSAGPEVNLLEEK
jgi:glucose-6-phosphate 1-dehydrogenase